MRSRSPEKLTCGQPSGALGSGFLGLGTGVDQGGEHLDELAGEDLLRLEEDRSVSHSASPKSEPHSA
eukprot:1642868-Rhodomonas_salina.4